MCHNLHAEGGSASLANDLLVSCVYKQHVPHAHFTM